MIYSLGYKFLSELMFLNSLKMLVVLSWLNASSVNVGLLRRCRDEEYLGQWMVMWAIVIGVLQMLHNGLGFLVIGYKCVRFVWSILAIIICSLQVELSGCFHLDVVFLMFFNLLSRVVESHWICYVFKVRF